MRFLSTIFWFSLLLIPLAIGVLAYQCLAEIPAVSHTTVLTAGKVARAKELLAEHDVRRLKDQEEKTLKVSASELSLVLSHVIQKIAAGGAIIELSPTEISSRSTVEIAALGKRRYINCDFSFTLGESIPVLRSFKVGEVSFPPRIVSSIVRFGLMHLYRTVDIKNSDEIIQSVAVKDRQLAVTYQWKPSIVDAVRSRVLPADELARLKIYNDLLSDYLDDKSHGQSLESVVRHLFQRPARNSKIVEENRAAIITLSNYVNGRRMSSLIPEIGSWRVPKPVKLTSHGRRDLAQHFATSAALAVAGGGTFADAIGLFKEIEDSDGGSGFSFKDLAADRAGTRFGEIAVNEQLGAKFRGQVASSTGEYDLIPALDGLEERLSEKAFQKTYDRVGSEAYQTVLATIERRLDASPLY